MKVVLFCGGQGLRIRDENSSIPKPMITVGYRPVLWHIMRYYASFGHKDFILCLGYRGDVIKRYFLEYDETVSNDFVLHGARREVALLASDIDDWRITFVDTGTTANIGERLKAVQPHLAGEEVFLANYSDGLTDMPLPDQLAAFERTNAVGTFLAAQSPGSFHVASYEPGGIVTSFGPITDDRLRVNGGYFAFRRTIFDYMRPGEELVAEPFARLIAERKLLAYAYNGFWAPMDTFKDRQALEDMYNTGKAPWMVWREGDPTGPDGAP